MRQIIITLFLLSIFAAFGQEAYSDHASQRAVEKACEILELYYPNKVLQFNNKICELQWFPYTMFNEELNDLLLSYDIDTDPHPSRCKRSKHLKKITSVFNKDVRNPEYIADFSAPLFGLIECYINPADRIVGELFGRPIIHFFTFGFDESGNIIYVERYEINFL